MESRPPHRSDSWRPSPVEAGEFHLLRTLEIKTGRIIFMKRTCSVLISLNLSLTDQLISTKGMVFKYLKHIKMQIREPINK